MPALLFDHGLDGARAVAGLEPLYSHAERLVHVLLQLVVIVDVGHERECDAPGTGDIHYITLEDRQLHENPNTQYLFLKKRRKELFAVFMLK
jgi:hypothetical protein